MFKGWLPQKLQQGKCDSTIPSEGLFDILITCLCGNFVASKSNGFFIDILDIALI